MIRTRFRLCAGMAAAVLLLAAGCKSSSHLNAARKPATDSNPLEIQVSPALREQLTVGEPSWKEVAASLQVAARVETDATRMARIDSPVNGRIVKLLVLEGERVRRGQVLATLHSTALSDTQFSFIKAYSQQDLDEKSLERARQLLAANVIGSAEVQRRQAEVLQATAEVAAYRQQLRALGVADATIDRLETTRKLNSEYQIDASISGTVLARKITIGQIVQPAEVTFVVADLSQVWLVADVPEQDAAELRVGKRVEAQIPALPDVKIAGKLSYVSPIVDPQTRTIATRMELPNPKGLFKPAMLASMTYEDAEQKKEVVPSTAVVREDNQDHVFVETGPRRFILREVTLGPEYGDVRVLEDGVHPGEKIVLTGAFNLNNQRKHNAIEGGM